VPFWDEVYNDDGMPISEYTAYRSPGSATPARPSVRRPFFFPDATMFMFPEEATFRSLRRHSASQALSSVGAWPTTARTLTPPPTRSSREALVMIGAFLRALVVDRWNASS
jgi:hypothetical protein